MEYRELTRGGPAVSVIGIGAGILSDASDAELDRMFGYAADAGLNFMDTVMAEDGAAGAVATALKGRRSRMVMQMHIGAIYPDGVYTRSRDLERVRLGFERELRKYGTDYADLGIVHYVDDDEDFDSVMNDGIFDYARSLKKSGAIRYLGFSSHEPAICRRFIETGEIDAFMLSVNAAYDFEAAGNERFRLYADCQSRGIGITVMKPFSGGRLLSERDSPFHAAMTTAQCLQYALDRPAVVSCLPGMSSLAEMRGILGYLDASPAERDYSFIGALGGKSLRGACAYCNHCLPCPSSLAIGSINKLYDLASAGDALARDHYSRLAKHASDCSGCGSCESRCPFGVGIRARMSAIAEFFGS
jgi:Predicted oxidoreductases of the aldo/keto reductase family